MEQMLPLGFTASDKQQDIHCSSSTVQSTMYHLPIVVRVTYMGTLSTCNLKDSSRSSSSSSAWLDAPPSSSTIVILGIWVSNSAALIAMPRTSSTLPLYWSTCAH